ncbi:FAD:protein FMN transferase [Oceanobacillus halophilus]|uniref:FAD:protein FMN transferase n=1 Tax=Oceanobacillus halophilus TaxID=930130 RepID=UPI003BAB09A0
MNNKVIIFILLAIILIITGCSNDPETHAEKLNLIENPYKQTEFLLGTVVTIKIYDEGKEEVLGLVFDKIEELDQKITADEEGSEINTINDKAGEEAVNVSEDIFQLITEGKNYSEVAEGSFDITIGPLTKLWHIGFDDARKPEQAEIDEILPLINYKKVELNEKNKKVFLKDKGMRMDLGAIAKGYIADEVVQLLKENGVTTAIIDLGGNIFVMGNHYSGNPWTVGIQDPFSGRGDTIGKLKASNKSIVTSGIYERYLEVDGVKYHHLLNPKDGYPFNNKLASVSIISDKSIDGDALSTVLFSKGLQDGLDFIHELEGVEAIFIMEDKTIYTTDGLTDNFEITNEQFTFGNE